MRQISAIILLLFSFAFAATVTWTGGTSTSAKLGANWSGGSFPATGDSVVFDNTSNTRSCSLDTNLVVKSINATSGFTNTLVMNKKFITVANYFWWDGTGVSTFDTTITQTGDGTIHFGSGTGVTYCYLDCQGTGKIDVDKAGLTIRKCEGSYTSKTTTQTGVGIGHYYRHLHLNGGAWACSSATIFGNTTISKDTIFSYATGSSIASSPSGNVYLVLGSSGGDTLYFQGIDFKGNRFYMYNSSAAVSPVVILTGNFSNNTHTDMYTASANFGFRFKTNGYSFYTWNLSFGSNATNAIPTLDCAGSEFTIVSWAGSAYNNAAGCVVNMDSSNWACSNGWTWGTNTTVNAGESNVKFTTNNFTVTSNNKTWADLMIDASGKKITFADSVVCRDFYVQQGKISLAGGKNIRASGNIGLGGADSLNLSTANITMTGSSKCFSSISTGVRLGDSATLYIPNSTVLYPGALQIKRVVMSPNHSYTWSHGDSIKILTHTLGDWSGTPSNLNYWQPIDTTKRFYIYPQQGTVVSYMAVRGSYNYSPDLVSADDGTNVDRGLNFNWLFTNTDTIPIIDSIRPRGALYAAGIIDTIFGRGFLGLPDTVWYGTAKAKIKTWTPTMIIDTIPVGCCGYTNVRVRNYKAYEDTLVGGWKYWWQYPPRDSVRVGFIYGPNGNDSTGTMVGAGSAVFPKRVDVRKTKQYGPNGTDSTGTLEVRPPIFGGRR